MVELKTKLTPLNARPKTLRSAVLLLSCAHMSGAGSSCPAGDWRASCARLVKFIDPPVKWSYQGTREACLALGAGWDLVSVKSVDHVKWLRDQATVAGVDLSSDGGVALGWDRDNTGDTHYDLTNSSRNITSIFDALREEGWGGDYYSKQLSSCGGLGQQWAGFGWRALPAPGIVDWGVCHRTLKIVCENLGTSSPTLVSTSSPTSSSMSDPGRGALAGGPTAPGKGSTV